MKNFDFNLFAFLVLGFIFCTIIGTLSHEFGHYVVGKILGFDVCINYKSTQFIGNPEISKKNRLLFTIGGPFQTMITGTVGFLTILIHRKTFYEIKKLSLKQWIMVFVTSFWLRQLFNFLTGVIRFVKKGSVSIQSDESKLDVYFNFQLGTITTVTATIGVLIMAFIFFRIIPKSQQVLFLISGFVGGLFGYLIWFEWIGEILIP